MPSILSVNAKYIFNNSKKLPESLAVSAFNVLTKSTETRRTGGTFHDDCQHRRLLYCPNLMPDIQFGHGPCDGPADTAWSGRSSQCSFRKCSLMSHVQRINLAASKKARSTMVRYCIYICVCFRALSRMKEAFRRPGLFLYGYCGGVVYGPAHCRTDYTVPPRGPLQRWADFTGVTPGGAVILVCGGASAES